VRGGKKREMMNEKNTEEYQRVVLWKTYFVTWSWGDGMYEEDTE